MDVRSCQERLLECPQSFEETLSPKQWRGFAFTFLRNLQDACFGGQLTMDESSSGSSFTISADFSFEPNECPSKWITFWLVGNQDPSIILLDQDSGEATLLPLTGQLPFPQDIMLNLVEQVLKPYGLTIATVADFKPSPAQVLFSIASMVQCGGIDFIPAQENKNLMCALRKISHQEQKQKQLQALSRATRIRASPEEKQQVDDQGLMQCDLFHSISQIELPSCKEPFTDASYHQLAVYIPSLTALAVRRLGKGYCFDGVLNIAVNRPDRKAQIFKWVRPVEPCPRDRKFSVVLGHLHFSPYQSQNLETIAQEVKQSQEPGHSVAIIFNEDDKTIEYFEPNGSLVDWTQPVIASLSQEFGKDYTIIESEEFCPVVSIQRLSGYAMCTSFSLLYLLLRTACSNLDKSAIVEGLLSLGKEKLNLLLQKFHCFQWNLAQESGIIEAFQLLSKPFWQGDEAKIKSWTEQVNSGLIDTALPAIRQYYKDNPQLT